MTSVVALSAVHVGINLAVSDAELREEWLSIFSGRVCILGITLVAVIFTYPIIEGVEAG